MGNTHFDPVGQWIAANIHCDLEEYSVTREEALWWTLMFGRDHQKLEYRIAGSLEHIGQEPSTFTCRFNPRTWAQHEVITYTNGETRESFDTPKLTTDGWFEPGQFVVRSSLLGTPKMMVMWRDFLIRKLLPLSLSPSCGFSMTTHNLRYLKITQEATDEDAGWGLYVDLEADCALYYCQYNMKHVMHKEIEVSSVHLLFSGETSFHEFERNDVGELTRVDSAAG